MKKNSILVAVFAIIIAASAAKAAEIIDFNGAKGLKPQSMHDIFATGQNSLPAGISENIPAAPMPEQPDEAQIKAFRKAFVDGIIKGAADYSSEKGMRGLAKDFQNLLTYGTYKEKFAFVYNKDVSYRFPDKIAAIKMNADKGAASDRFGMGNKSQTCFASHDEQVCNQKKVCRYVCAGTFTGLGSLGGGFGAGVGLGIGHELCQDICEDIEECTTVTVCDQWVTDPGTEGLTDSHGNYRGRGVEFQRD